MRPYFHKGYSQHACRRLSLKKAAQKGESLLSKTRLILRMKRQYAALNAAIAKLLSTARAFVQYCCAVIRRVEKGTRE